LPAQVESDASPSFNSCWQLLPPGPDFQSRLAEYAGSHQPNAIELGCVPLYQLNESTCRKFAEVGPGEWPDDVSRWCRDRYAIQLQQTTRTR
jgi:hypothetical protein